MNTNAEWYWAKQDSDEQNGPVSRERLEKLVEQDDFKPEDLVWREGFDDWKEAGSVEEVKELFPSPPPLPDEQENEADVTGDEPPPLPQEEEQSSSDGDQKTKDIITVRKGKSTRKTKNLSNRSNAETEDNEEEETFWKRHPVWTAVISLLLIFAFYNGIDGSSSSDIPSVDSVSTNTAYMSHTFTFDPKELEGTMRSGFRETYKNEMGGSIYQASRYIEEKADSIDKIKINFISDECQYFDGTREEYVPSGSYTLDDLEEINDKKSEKVFKRSGTWKGIMAASLQSYDECSGSFAP